MSRKENTFAVAKENLLVTGLGTVRLNEQRTALLGCIVKIENVVDSSNVAIKFLDKTSTYFEETLYCCKISALELVAESVWPLLLGIPSPMIRVDVVSNTHLCDHIMSLKVGCSVEVLHNKIFYKGFIKYIGPVQAMGQGSVFGLELLVRSQSQVTSYDGSYAGTRYFNALPGTGLFVTLEKLKSVLTYLSTINMKYESNYPAFENSGDVERQHRAGRGESDIDLIELMGGLWPGVIDKRSSTEQATSKYPRNKSLNIVSHLISNRKTNKPKTETFVSHVNNSLLEKGGSESTDNEEGLTIGTLVEVSTDVCAPLYGVVRWTGGDGLAGVELEQDVDERLPLELTDGTHNGQRRFTCPGGRALFVPRAQCRRDGRFAEPDERSQGRVGDEDDDDGADDGSAVVPGCVAPLSMPTERDVAAVCGKFCGIQGHHNSCYLDATLFAMFTYTSVFDSVLLRPRDVDRDVAGYEEVQRVLREEIVNPLRRKLYVRAGRVMKLRRLLDDLSSVRGLTSEEKDPEEFLNGLLAQILRAEPLLKLSSGQEAFHYQLFVEKVEGLTLPSVQQLFEQSFLASDVRLKEVPSCLIVQMPRFGNSYKVYERVLPSQLLDVTDVIEGSPRQCTVCGRLASHECRECLGQCGAGLESTAFCDPCLTAAHQHTERRTHRPRALMVPREAAAAFAAVAASPPRHYMELFAVVCIETSHYVAFVKCGTGHEAPWCFFDSMADRRGEQNGYNIPEMVACPDMSGWLADDGAASRAMHEAAPNDKQLPEHAKRLLCDAYICMYQSSDVMMYR